MRLLLTGGAGYIGSHTALEFLENTDVSLTIIDNLSTGFLENIQYLKNRFPDRINFARVDLSDRSALEALLEKTHFDGVLHFGASLIVNESVSNPLLYYSNNTLNTTALIQACITHKIKNFIFSSTAAVYGEPDSRYIPVQENTPLAPINPYGASKMMSEQILKDSSLAYDFNFIALRYFNVAGANIHNAYDDNNGTKDGLGQRSKNATHLIKVACECAVGKREKMAIFGDDYPTDDGTCIRDYIHINDLANAHLQAWEYLMSEKKSDIFNVGYAQGYSVKEVISTLKEVSGVDFKVEILPRRAGDPAKLIANNQKILSMTQWKPKYNNLKTIVASAYEWEKYLL
ncbi:UDP-glucose 4-epimerase GalE [Helicobacter sp. 11S02596-1]|uniref:UDP-glucose 4-epimerase GalE n=1 Tax=Helicobacter sp. 11S02596-1 TaxID=1476194 RepID=UPI000BA72620|nr:UDP-glucose 4-epimerase GalE [Helicobacter sp. 11S02596-1]PAF44773.1 UDP-glucose 4-epimerase GalE [Helicobacter sp. 11S02596-1]